MDNSGFNPTALSPLPPSSSFAPVAFNPSDFNIPGLQEYFKQAYSSLVPYYTALLNQAGQDYTIAVKMLQESYDQGERFNQEDLAQTTQQTTDNLAAALKQLGLTDLSEQQTLENTLNKRGIALTDTGTGKNVVGDQAEGEAGYEFGQLTDSQQLRKEAQQRTAAQTIASATLSSQQKTQGSQLGLQQGTENQTLGLQKTQQGLNTSMQTEAGNIAGQMQTNQTEQQNLNLQAKIAKAQVAGTSGAPGGFEPTDEYAKSHFGMSLADYYAKNPSVKTAFG